MQQSDFTKYRVAQNGACTRELYWSSIFIHPSTFLPLLKCWWHSFAWQKRSCMQMMNQPYDDLAPESPSSSRLLVLSCTLILSLPPFTQSTIRFQTWQIYYTCQWHELLLQTTYNNKMMPALLSPANKSPPHRLFLKSNRRFHTIHVRSCKHSADGV